MRKMSYFAEMRLLLSFTLGSQVKIAFSLPPACLSISGFLKALLSKHDLKNSDTTLAKVHCCINYSLKQPL